MNRGPNQSTSTASTAAPPTFDRRLATYLAAGASGSLAAASEAKAVIVYNNSVLPFGINEEVNIDFNTDGQIDWQIDHDRVSLNGNNLDYLQLDKNDLTSAMNPLAIDTYPGGNYTTFPVNGTNPNSDAGVLSFTNDLQDLGGYPVALKEGDVIGGSFANPTGSFVPGTIWDFQEGDNFLNTHTYIRANRLIDEDMMQIDANAGRAVTVPFGPQPEFPEVDDWIGLDGEVRYLGVRLDLNDAARAGINPNDAVNNPNYHQQHWYGWIGVRITNEADSTGAIVGWAYESEQGVSIAAGATGSEAVPGDYNGNGTVDAADYVIWRKNSGLMGGATPSQGDGTGDGNVNVDDYNFWRTNFGNGTGVGAAAGISASTAAVPEPSSLLLGAFAAIAVVGAFLIRRIRRS